uniref:PA700 subunit P58=ATP-dependent 20 S proteasome activator (Fragments) n=1 Tax=Bos taurus TaxID=9913 RepID=Q9TS76_BOVIN
AKPPPGGGEQEPPPPPAPQDVEMKELDTVTLEDIKEHVKDFLLPFLEEPMDTEADLQFRHDTDGQATLLNLLLRLQLDSPEDAEFIVAK